MAKLRFCFKKAKENLLENSTIRTLLTGCSKNDRQSQKQLFFRLQIFGLRICYRYSSIYADPTVPLYERFIKLFSNITESDLWPGLSLKSDLKNRFKNILIEKCINAGQKENESLSHRNVPISIIKQKFQPTAKEIIDKLRMLPYAFRLVFNLAAIDGFSYNEIADKLCIPVSDVQAHLEKARKLLNTSLLRLPQIKSA